MSNHCPRLPSLVAATLLAACGGSATSSTTATVQLQPIGTWTGSAEVFVNSPAGAFVSRTPVTTSVDVPITDGDTVTIALTTDGRTDLVSDLGVQRGDVIALPVSSESADSLTTVDVTFPDFTGATAWHVGTPNSVTDSSDENDVTVSVPNGTTATPFLGTVADDTGALAVYANLAEPITGGATPAIALSTTVPFTAVPVSATNAPEDIPADDVVVSAGVILDDNDDSLVLAQVGSDVIVPTSFGDRVEVDASAFGSNDSVFAGAVVASLPSGGLAIDLSVPDLPAVSQPALTASGASWTLAGGGDYDDVSASLLSSTNTAFSWFVLMPPDTTSLVLPTLPSDIAVPTLDGFSVGPDETSSVDGYADVLHEGFTLPAGATYETRSVSLDPPATSSVVRARLHNRATSASRR